MVGGEEVVFSEYEYIFKALAISNGYARVGGPGAGHFVKMVHNGIEYGMMGAIAEGMSVLHKHENQFSLDLNQVLRPYENGSIISSALMSYLGEAYDKGLTEEIRGEVPIGETESEMEYIVKELGEVKVLEAALAQRKKSRKHPTYVGKLIAAMRNQFGGHKTLNK